MTVSAINECFSDFSKSKLLNRIVFERHFQYFTEVMSGKYNEMSSILNLDYGSLFLS